MYVRDNHLDDVRVLGGVVNGDFGAIRSIQSGPALVKWETVYVFTVSSSDENAATKAKEWRTWTVFLK
jgi:hypothetical protein